MLARCYEKGSHGLQRDLSRARDLFRLSAEKLCNEAMSNISRLPGMLQDFDTSIRWCKAAGKYGYLEAQKEVSDLQKQRSLWSNLSEQDQINFGSLMTRLNGIFSAPPVDFQRETRPPSIEELSDILSPKPYILRLLGAKKLIKEGIGALKNSEHKKALILFAQAKSVPEAILIVEKKESLYIQFIADHYSAYETCSDEDRDNLGILSLPQTSEPIQLASYYEEMHRRYPENITFTTALAAWNAG
ncbi:hypothetical protein HK096_010124, partial [Nowakowskiella sp. JEL0078]